MSMRSCFLIHFTDRLTCFCVGSHLRMRLNKQMHISLIPDSFFIDCLLSVILPGYVCLNGGVVFILLIQTKPRQLMFVLGLGLYISATVICENSVTQILCDLFLVVCYSGIVLKAMNSVLYVFPVFGPLRRMGLITVFDFGWWKRAKTWEI